MIEFDLIHSRRVLVHISNGYGAVGSFRRKLLQRALRGNDGLPIMQDRNLQRRVGACPLGFVVPWMQYGRPDLRRLCQIKTAGIDIFGFSEGRQRESERDNRAYSQESNGLH